MPSSSSLEKIPPGKLLDVLIQAGLIAALVALCCKIFAPFLTLMLWALIPAVTLYPVQQMIARKFSRRQGWAATAMVLIGIVLIVVPTFFLGSSLADSITRLVHGMRAIHRRIVGAERGDRFTTLSTATIRAVALGVLGVAAIQAILIGLVLIVVGIPHVGVLAIIALVLGIAQIPTFLVTLPVIVYVWMSGDYETTSAIFYTILLLVSGFSDNVLKPLLLGRGVEAPMPVILLGALGGMVSAGILGMFAGAVLLTLGYQLFMAWVSNAPTTTGSEMDTLGHAAGIEADPAA